MMLMCVRVCPPCVCVCVCASVYRVSSMRVCVSAFFKHKLITIYYYSSAAASFHLCFLLKREEGPQTKHIIYIYICFVYVIYGKLCTEIYETKKIECILQTSAIRGSSSSGSKSPLCGQGPEPVVAIDNRERQCWTTTHLTMQRKERRHNFIYLLDLNKL